MSLAKLAPSPQAIAELRSFSRQLVRELGYLRSPVAGSELPPSTVHAILEIGMQPGIQARDLAQTLRLDKSNTSRQLAKLESLGLVRRQALDSDGRSTALFLTDEGLSLFAQAEAFGTQQVAKVLGQLDEVDQQALGRYLSLYAQALAQDNPHALPPQLAVDRLVEGYRPGCLGEIAGFFAPDLQSGGFAAERAMTEELTGFLAGLPRADAKLWLYHQDGHTLGSIALEAGPAPRQATLRWFGVKNTERGTGIGRQLLESALAHADLVFDAVWCSVPAATPGGVRAARLLAAHGFHPHGTVTVQRWGQARVAQRWCRQRA
ncbi:bifunctional helix-turn-helix transcriptional regulator/GNAT family N-acetyltransferase [Comamonadaceae bacterium PP-2]